KLYWGHLQTCENFKADYNKNELLDILAQLVPEDAKKKDNKADEVDSESEDDEISTTNLPTLTNQPSL
ncbi:23695_t:CDS:2, partial [Racocetra persica]